MAITKEQAIDILDKFGFFQGQRAGRELWNNKPYEVQEEDIKAFSKDVAELKAYIADVVPKSEVEKLVQDVTRLEQEKEALIKNYAECMKDYARDIFEEIEKYNRPPIPEAKPIYTLKENELAELKKKYTESEK